MASQVNPPRGMRDFLPADKARREHVLSVIRSTFRAHGFDEIETPVVEDSDRLHAGLGGDNEKLAFAVMRRGLTNDDLVAAGESGDYLDLADLGLRFDLTVPLARFYASHRGELPAVFRAIQIAPVWRAERPQRGRFRQFVQCDIDIIGEAGPLAEIELIAATTAAVEALGVEGTTIRINDRRILRRIVEQLGISADDYEHALVIIDKEDKIGVSGVVEELVAAELGDAAVMTPILESLADLPGDGWELHPSTSWLDADAYDDLKAIRAAVGGSAKLVFSPNLVRGMGYYTGTIFEIAHPDLPYSLGGGGRYDGMIGRFLGQDVPAAGFSLGFERLVELVELPEDGAAEAIALVYDADVTPARLAALKAELTTSGSRVRLERRTKNPKPLLDQLAASGFTRFAFVSSQAESLADLEIRPITAQ
ncbi:MAG TPA: histidine--tRNA ligase [Galbitalea sp.]